MKRSVLILAAFLSACALPPPDQPAAFNRMGRFMGLVANCGCSDVTPNRMLAEYPRAVAGLYSEADIGRMRGYVDLGAHERWDNQTLICIEVCSQTCMVNAVAKPLGGRLRGDGATCRVTERDVRLPFGESLPE